MRTWFAILLWLASAAVLAGDPTLAQSLKSDRDRLEGLLPVPRTPLRSPAMTAERARRASPVPDDPAMGSDLADDRAPNGARPDTHRAGETPDRQGSRWGVLAAGGAVVALAAGAAVAVFLLRRRRTPVRRMPPLALFGLEGDSLGGRVTGLPQPQANPTGSRRAA
ncbi:MAG: hypothetical protein ABSG86_23365 [Thermoguttaceae bacterium]|jgi:hypothetical protein